MNGIRVISNLTTLCCDRRRTSSPPSDLTAMARPHRNQHVVLCNPESRRLIHGIQGAAMHPDLMQAGLMFFGHRLQTVLTTWDILGPALLPGIGC
jgi:hypothetical protein